MHAPSTFSGTRGAPAACPCSLSTSSPLPPGLLTTLGQGPDGMELPKGNPIFPEQLHQGRGASCLSPADPVLVLAQLFWGASSPQQVSARDSCCLWASGATDALQDPVSSAQRHRRVGHLDAAASLLLGPSPSIPAREETQVPRLLSETSGHTGVMGLQGGGRRGPTDGDGRILAGQPPSSLAGPVQPLPWRIRPFQGNPSCNHGHKPCGVSS